MCIYFRPCSLVVVPSGPPAGVKEDVLNSTAAWLSWRPPVQDRQNGEIVSYSVAISGNASSRLVQYDLTTNSTSIGLFDLRPFSEYNVSIAASTGIGMGPFTAPHVFHTPEDG